ncbi:MAG TPA: type I secretion system permease/ATPase, partial [Dongiaceae bacterium]|nr:type I secretion system permease/ATPase [Dongiaceae bacterium]
VLGSWIEARLAPNAFLGVIKVALRDGSYQTEALRDLASLRLFMTGGAVTPLLDAPWVPVFIAATYILHPLLGHVAIVSGILLLGIALVGELANRTSLATAGSATMAADRAALSVARSAESIEAMGMTEAMLQRWFATNAEAVGYAHRAAVRAGALGAFTKFVRLTVQLMLMACGAYLVLQHQLTGGAMIAASIIMGRALAPIEQTIAGMRQMFGARLAYRRLKRHLDETASERITMPPPAPEGAVTAEGITFLPPGQPKPALHDLSFMVAPGEILAVIGPAAAGKSTLARLLAGLSRPSKGSVRLDGADVAIWPRDDLGRYIGYLPQQVTLLPGTVGENIARFSVGTPEQIVAAARMARIHEMVLRLPQGYDTVIGETDARLSGGQRQRIALARALYGDPRFVILDEPHSNLDSEAEAALAQTLQDLKARHCTVVVITHRFGLVTLADKVLALRDGGVEFYAPRQAFLDRLAPREVAPVPRAVGQDDRS